MKRKVTAVALFLLLTAAWLPAQTIVMVADSTSGDTGWRELLEGAGYTYVSMPDAFDDTISDDNKQVLRDADLIIVSRDTNSGDYDEDPAFWNSLETPILNATAYLSRDSRWFWLPSEGTPKYTGQMQVLVDHEIFQGVDLGEDGLVDVIDEEQNFVDTTSAGNGQLLAVNADNDRVWIVYWETGVQYHQNSSFTAGGPRMWFAAGADSDPKGHLNFTEAGETILLNAVRFLIEGPDPNYNYPPVARIANPVFQQVQAQAFPVQVDLTATAEDDGNPDGSVVTAAWTATGPAAVVFADATAFNTTATFTAAGLYELTLTVSDGEKTAPATMTVRVVDEFEPMAYWPLDQIVDPNDILDAANNNDGVITNEPNLVAGLFDNAIEFFGDGYIEITPDLNADPNFTSEPSYGATVSAWIRVDEFTGDWQTVVSRGDDSWRLARNSRTAQGSTRGMAFHLSGIPGNGPSGSIPVDDGLWHHVAGTYDGQTLALYIDGVLDVTQATSGQTINMSSNPIVIGGQIHNGALQRLWNGTIDEVKVWNYGFTAEQVRAMTAMASTPPHVSVVPFPDPIQYRFGDVITLEGAVEDYGIPSATSILWTTVQSPVEGVEAVFADPGSPTTTVEFPEFGTYILALTASDDIATVTTEVTITLESPSCADVIAEGHVLVGDLNSDCSVDLADFAIMAANWLRCNDPSNRDCEWPF